MVMKPQYLKGDVKTWGTPWGTPLGHPIGVGYGVPYSVLQIIVVIELSTLLCSVKYYTH